MILNYFIDDIISEYRIHSPSAVETAPYRLNGKIKTIQFHEDRWNDNRNTIYHFNHRKKVIKIERINTTKGTKHITRIFYDEKDKFIKEELEVNNGSKFLIKELIYSDDNLPYLIKRYDLGIPIGPIRMTYNDLEQVSKDVILDENNELKSIINYEYDLNGNCIKSTVKYINDGRINVNRFKYDKFNRQILYDMQGKTFYKKIYDERGFVIKQTCEKITAEGTLIVAWTSVLDYNLRGDVTHVKGLTPEGNIKRILEYQYTYDDRNNIIECIRFDDGKKISTTKYDISYYE